MIILGLLIGDAYLHTPFDYMHTLQDPWIGVIERIITESLGIRGQDHRWVGSAPKFHLISNFKHQIESQAISSIDSNLLEQTRA